MICIHVRDLDHIDDHVGALLLTKSEQSFKMLDMLELTHLPQRDSAYI